MSVSFSLRQITSVVDGPLYRVNNEVSTAVGASPAVFVFKTLTQTFSHYATVADLENYPDTYAQAASDDTAFYRQTSVTRDWETVELREADIALTKTRLQFLANELNTLQASLASDTTTVITSE
jgi:hypothetical protein